MAGVKRRPESAAGLFQAAVGIGVKRTYIAGDVQRGTIAQRQLAAQGLCIQPRQRRRRDLPGLIGIDYGIKVQRLRRIRRSDTNFPLLSAGLHLLTRQVQTGNLYGNLAITKAGFRRDRNLQRGACTFSQRHTLAGSTGQIHQATAGEIHLQGLRQVGQVSEIQRQ